MNNFMSGIVIYLLIAGIVTGATVSSEYSKCKIPVSDEQLVDIAQSSVLWPLVIGSTLYVRPQMLEKTKCEVGTNE